MVVFWKHQIGTLYLGSWLWNINNTLESPRFSDKRKKTSTRLYNAACSLRWSPEGGVTCSLPEPRGWPGSSPSPSSSGLGTFCYPHCPLDAPLSVRKAPHTLSGNLKGESRASVFCRLSQGSGSHRLDTCWGDWKHVVWRVRLEELAREEGRRRRQGGGRDKPPGPSPDSSWPGLIPNRSGKAIQQDVLHRRLEPKALHKLPSLILFRLNVIVLLFYLSREPA